MQKLIFRNLLNFIFICFLSIFKFANAAPDIVAQNYAAANSPGIQSCTVGYDLLSGDIAYQQSLISSKIPYSLNYKAPLRLNLSAAQTFAQPENTTTGWSDNYQSSIIIQNINSKTTQYTSYRTEPAFGNPGYYWLFMLNPVTTEVLAKLIIVRLPGETIDTVFKEEKGGFSRLYSADAVRDMNNYSLNQLPWNTDLGEYSLNRINGNLVIIKNGVRYTVSSDNSIIAPTTTSSSTLNAYIDKTGSLRTTTSFWRGVNGGAGIKFNGVSNVQSYIETTLTASVDLHRVVRIDAKGRSLDFQYDGNLNLTKVKDQYNNQLLLERSFHDTSNGTAQTIDESRLVTKVSYANAGQPTSQIAEFKYQAYDVRTPSTGIVSKVYALIESNSTAAGKNIYVNALTEIGAIKGYIRSKGRVADDSYNYPILRQVKNSLSEIVRQWDVTQNYSVAYFGRYNPAETTLRSFTPNTSGTAFDNTSVYNDIDGSITTSIALGGSTGSNTIRTTLDTSSTGKITISSSGYPCLTSGKTPVSSAEFNTERSRLNKITDANNVTSSFSYDMQGRLTTATEAVGNTLGRTTSYVYGVLENNIANSFTVPTEIKTPNITVTNVVDVNGNITSQTQTSSQSGSTSKVTAYTYYSDASQPNYGLLNSVDGPRTGTTDKIIYTYDNFGNLASQSQTVNGAVRTTSYIGYNTFAQPERVVNSNGLVNQFVYNADSTIRSSTTGTGSSTGAITGQTVSYGYDELKRVISQKNPDGEITSYQYNLAGQKSLVILPNGNRVSYTYFPIGIVASEVETNSGNAVASEKYTVIDSNGRIAKSYSGNNPNQRYTAYSYDNNGNVVQSTTALGITEKWSYDVLNRVKIHTDGEGNIDVKDYDINDNITFAKDALNAGSSSFSYRNGNVLTQEVNTDYATKTYAYNEMDQLTAKSHGSRNCNYLNIDILGRESGINCTSENDADNVYSYNYQYTYDGSRFGRLDSVSSSTIFGVNTQYSYDDLNRITRKTQVNKSITNWGGSSHSLNVGYTYSAADKITSITMPSGRVIAYNYDGNMGRLASIHIAGNPFISSINYNNLGQLSSWNIENTSAKYSIGYDSSKSGAVKFVNFINKNNSVLYSEDYGFDADGRITSITKLNSIKTYTYDRTNRLIGDESGSYTYDKNGNRTSYNSNIYSYVANTNRLIDIKAGGTTIKSANYLTTGEMRFAPFISGYDGSGQMRYSGGANGQYFMAYNHKNERTVRSLNTSGSWYDGAIQYFYDENSNLIGEYAANGTPIVEYIWMGSRPVAAIYGSGSSTKIYVVVTDSNNTPRMLVDNSTNNAVWEWESTAFGVGKPTGNIVFNLRFPGQYYDEFTGLHYNLNRYYNPDLGRYMEPDPIGLEGGLNPYAYAGSNPVMNSDPSGLLLMNIEDIALSNIGFQNSINDWGFLWKAVNYQPPLPTVQSANKNLKINGGSGNNVQVDASRIRVEPNGSKKWQLNDSNNRYQLTVRATGWKNNAGQWVDEGWNSVPTQSSRAYWVYGELTLSDNLKLYDDPYDFEYHSLSDASSITGKAGIVGRNFLTYIGAKNAKTPPGAVGYKHEFYNQPYCPSCPPLPKKK